MFLKKADIYLDINTYLTLIAVLFLSSHLKFKLGSVLSQIAICF